PTPVTPAPTQSAAPPLSPSQAKRRYTFYVIVAVVLAGIGGGIVALVSMHARHPQRPSEQVASEPTQLSSAPAVGTSPPPTQQPQATPSTASPIPKTQTPPPAQVQSETAASTQPPAQGTGASGAVVHQVLPDTPQTALQTIRGHVHVAIRVQVDNAGKVSNAAIAERGPSQYFAHLALEASQKWTFQPSPGEWLLHYTFAQTGVDASAEPAVQ
ncbi:MAG: TonB family protein, partial [Acidobacteriota bacterium]|nr:TonB family protein [Acidobacteriota bacterium]